MKPWAWAALSRAALALAERLFGETPKPSRHVLALLILAGVTVGGACQALSEGPDRPFHVTWEGFFGADTYVGGSDKASHFVDFSLVSRELAILFVIMGYLPDRSRLTGFGLAVLAGLMIELGDGLSWYGFSPEDLLMDVLGAGASWLIGATRTGDLFGVRRGFLLFPPPQACCPVDHPGPDVSNMVFTGDLAMDGVAGRLGLQREPLRRVLRYVFLSTTYGTKGYARGWPALRERQVGLEVGLNLKLLLDDLGVRRDTWWGYVAHAFGDAIRFPFTALGYRYDLNHLRWHGPDNGNSMGPPRS